ncbi:MAG: contractile injection system protein, VgrG/Pvc8 family, partial [Myxococcota bacterium]
MSAVTATISSPDFDASSFVVDSIVVHERVGALFEVDVVATTMDSVGLRPGMRVTVRVREDRPAPSASRSFTGMVIDGEHTVPPEPNTPRQLRFQVRPEAYRLALVRTQEVFVDHTVLEVLEEKLVRVGLAGVASFSVSELFPPRN